MFEIKSRLEMEAIFQDAYHRMEREERHEPKSAIRNAVDLIRLTSPSSYITTTCLITDIYPSVEDSSSFYISLAMQLDTAVSENRPNGPYYVTLNDLKVVTILGSDGSSMIAMKDEAFEIVRMINNENIKVAPKDITKPKLVRIK